MTKKIRPLHDRLIVKLSAEQEKTPGGLFIPDAAKEKPAEGRVLAIGTGRILADGAVRALDVKVGDRVLFAKFAGTNIAGMDDDHLMLKEEDVLGVVEEGGGP